MNAPLFPPEVRFVSSPVGDARVLHPDEQALAGAMSPARRREFASGRACAHRALAALGVPDAPLLRGERRMPLWPDGVVGSITHSGGFCAAAVARRSDAAGVGLDAEVFEPLSKRVLERICRDSERRALGPLGEHAPELWGTVVFSAKECLYKAYFPLTGAFLGFRDAKIALDPANGRFEARLRRDDAPDAAGRRRFEGRFAIVDGLVWTGLVIPPGADAPTATGS